MPKALVAYASRTEKTKQIGELIAEGLRFSGVEVETVSANDLKKKEDLEGYDAVIFGSATYHGEMMKAMKTLLFLAEQADLKGKAGGSFGSYGWSGEAAGRIYDTMLNIFEMDLASSPLMLKSATIEGGMKAAQAYGTEIAEKIS